MSTEEADDVANRFFSELGDVAKQYNTMLCIEPNAPQYNCDYITTADEGRATCSHNQLGRSWSTS